METKNYYAILQVTRHATEAEIKSAYRKLAKEYHPDIRPNDKVSEETFKTVTEAYNGEQQLYERKPCSMQS